MTPEPRNPRNETWTEKGSIRLAAWRRKRYFTDDPPLKPGNPFKKGGPRYKPYPKEAQGNLIFFDPIDQNRVEDEQARLYKERYAD